MDLVPGQLVQVYLCHLLQVLPAHTGRSFFPTLIFASFPRQLKVGLICLCNQHCGQQNFPCLMRLKAYLLWLVFLLSSLLLSFVPRLIPPLPLSMPFRISPFLPLPGCTGCRTQAVVPRGYSLHAWPTRRWLFIILYNPQSIMKLLELYLSL